MNVHMYLIIDASSADFAYAYFYVCTQQGDKMFVKKLHRLQKSAKPSIFSLIWYITFSVKKVSQIWSKLFKRKNGGNSSNLVTLLRNYASQ
jgi:hypothetical protein